MHRLAMVVAMFAMFDASANAQSEIGDTHEGREFARNVCIACHLVDKTETNDTDYEATAFQTIADNIAHTRLSLRVFLTTPHKDMPNLVLTDTQTDNIIAYILSLR